MGILQFPAPLAGQVGVIGAIKYMTTTDSLATLTTAGYLNNPDLAVYPISPSDIIGVTYNYSFATNSGSFGFFSVSISKGIITLSEESSSGIVLPTVANHIATYTNTTGTLSEDAATAINGGNIQAGLSGTAGTLASFPATAARGSLKVVAVANAGNTNTTISNAAMGQASVVSIPDPGTATATFALAPAALVSGNVVKASGTAGLLVDAGFALHSGTTAAYAGGGTSNTFVTTNMTAASIVTAVILASTNSVSINKAVPGTNTLAVTFSADPGSGTTINWISVTAIA